MDAFDLSNKKKVSIKGFFSNEDLQKRFSPNRTRLKPRYYIRPHKDFEIAQLPTGKVVKYAYKKVYDRNTPDIDIELEWISKYEQAFYKAEKARDSRSREEAVQGLKQHYKATVAIISPKMAAGWNRWSEDILDLFLEGKIHKILWGSGNCGKSAVMAILLYIKWRIRPNKRMVVIVAKIVQDATARVWGYLKEFHAQAPASANHTLLLVDNSRVRGIYCMMLDEKSGKVIPNERACMICLPAKVDAKNATIGGNMLGKHPDERLILAFDEAQELPGLMLNMPIFLNWYTNSRLDVYAWGNPSLVNFNAPNEQDLLFRLGAGHLSLSSLKQKQKNARKTDKWHTADTAVLRFSMLDSPKDDPEEMDNYVVDEDGNKVLRLHFLGGKDTVERISQKTNPSSPSWYSQVLGFPFIDTQGGQTSGVLTPFMVKASREYPLYWKDESKLDWFMGVDPSVTGDYDDCSIVCARGGMMLDGRYGLDFMNGKHCLRVQKVDDEEFVDTTINAMWALSERLGIPLKNIAIETHSVGETLRYALIQHMQNEKNPKWAKDRGEEYLVVSPTRTPTERLMFKQLGKMIPAKDMCADAPTEHWVAARCGFLTRQIFNVPDFILHQFYNRYLLLSGSGVKYKVEKKEDMKKRGVPSPSDADAFCNVIECARVRGKFGFRFYNTSKYNKLYGEEYDLKQQQKIVSSRIGVVSGILGISLPGSTKGPKKSGGWKIDPV